MDKEPKIPALTMAMRKNYLACFNLNLMKNKLVFFNF